MTLKEKKLFFADPQERKAEIHYFLVILKININPLNFLNMKQFLMFFATLIVAFSANSQISPDFEPCIGSGGSSGLNNLRLLVAKSNDGMNWTRTNLVLSDRSSVADGLVLPSGRLLVYYVAGCIKVNGSEQPANHIKVAVSDDKGKSWTYKNVQFNNLPSGGTLPVDPNVVLLEDGSINMLVTIDPDQNGPMNPCTYSAVSTDGGFSFTLSNSYVFSVSGTDILDPENFRFGTGNWKLWAGGIPGKNIMGISTDEAISFNNQGVFCSASNVNNSSECYIVADVIKYDASTYKMYAFGTSPSGQLIRSLSSTDGDTWTLDPIVNLTVQPSSGVEDLDVWAPTVLKLSDTSFIMVYETRIPSTASTNFNYINILQNDTTLFIGDTLRFVARTYFSDNSIRDVTFFGRWHSTNTSVASIDNYGKLTALSQGTTYIYKSYGGINSDSVFVTIDQSTQINNEKNNSLHVLVYPNPVSVELVIEIDANTDKLIFEIFNTIGQVVFKGNLIERTTIQTSNFAPGMYFIKFENGKTFEFKKIIKE